MAAENWTFWLNMTNFALGIITVLAMVIVFGAVGWDLIVRRVNRVPTLDKLNVNNLDADLRAMLQGSHSLSVPGLGLTMADGGERLEPSEAKNSDEKHGK